jgi:TPR repeat protein
MTCVPTTQPYHGEALHMLADVYHDGTDTIGIDHVKSVRLYERACESGHACEACVSAGSMYFHGKGAPRDLDKAFALYRRGAKQGSLQGWRNIASMHMEGDGVPKDEALGKDILEYVRHAEEKQKMEKMEIENGQRDSV